MVAACQLRTGSLSFSVRTEWIISPVEELGGGSIPWAELCDSSCIARLLSRMNFASREEADFFCGRV